MSILSLFKDFMNSFFEKRLLLKAAALSYTSVLTLLPLITITFSFISYLIAQVDPAQIDQILEFVLTHMIPQLELLEQPINASPNVDMLTKVEIKEAIKEVIFQLGSGEIGLIGVSIFLFLAFSLLLTIEHSLNDIWGVAYGRAFVTRIALYWTILTLGTAMYLLAILFTTQWQGSPLLKAIKDIPFLPALFQFVLPFVLCWIALSFLYLVLPNATVSWKAGILGGIIGGTLLQLNNILSFLYLYNIATATRLYGKLGILPIFLAGLYVSWLIVLSGAQLTRNLEDYFNEPPPKNKPLA